MESFAERHPKVVRFDSASLAEIGKKIGFKPLTLEIRFTATVEVGPDSRKDGNVLPKRLKHRPVEHLPHIIRSIEIRITRLGIGWRRIRWSEGPTQQGIHGKRDLAVILCLVGCRGREEKRHD